LFLGAFSATWAGLYLHHATNISAGGYDSLQLWIHGGSSGRQKIRVKLADGSNNLSDDAVTITAPANSWTQVSIPLNLSSG
jgi:hypothetical protein